MSGLYAADGSINVTVVDGSVFTGLYAADGSINVKKRASEYGSYHACGALLVTNQTGNANDTHSPDGSLNVSTSPYYTNTLRVTTVSGSFGPPPSGNYYPWLMF